MSGRSGRFRERSVPTPQQVKAERDEGRADNDPEGVCRQDRRRIPAGSRAGNRRDDHPSGQAPVDSSGPDMADRCRGGGHARDGDIRACCRGRRGASCQKYGQPDVSQHEPEEAAGERHDEAPDAHPDQQQGVHRLNKTR
jgi:hypothetical protein